jgi:hypothetical protein
VRGAHAPDHGRWRYPVEPGARRIWHAWIIVTIALLVVVLIDLGVKL